uniref:Uncharacterized protein n=1 Tax=Phlebotomus papatasi TaxID=29031 RepID=A0A1B0DEG3_PHLPP
MPEIVYRQIHCIHQAFVLIDDQDTESGNVAALREVTEYCDLVTCFCEGFHDGLEYLIVTLTSRVSYSYRNRPRNPLETAVWWAEHVIKTGGAPLSRSHSIDLPWYIYHSLDVIATLLLGLLIFLSGWIWFIRRLLFGFTSKTQAPTQKIKQN